MSKSPEELVESLSHAGVKGMKWGVRQSKRVTGVSRMKGAALDLNQRRTNQVQRFQAGKKTTGEKIINAPAKLLAGKKYAENLAKTETKLKAHRERIESGKTTFNDKLDTLNYVGLGDLLVSQTEYTK